MLWKTRRFSARSFLVLLRPSAPCPVRFDQLESNDGVIELQIEVRESVCVQLYEDRSLLREYPREPAAYASRSG